MKVIEQGAIQGLVSLSEYGVIAVHDSALLEAVSAAGLFETEANMNGVCGGAEVNTVCEGSNAGCVASPNVACGSNQVCSEVDSPV